MTAAKLVNERKVESYSWVAALCLVHFPNAMQVVEL